MGNPHCVVFVKNVDNIDVPKIGPLFEHNSLFPERVNTEFVKVISPTKIKMRVWERGNGETWACGTGACATAVAACKIGRAGRKNRIIMDGGNLKIRYTGERVIMTGECREIFEGVVEV